MRFRLAPGSMTLDDELKSSNFRRISQDYADLRGNNIAKRMKIDLNCQRHVVSH